MSENWTMPDKILLAIRDEFEQNNEALRRESMALADANRELTRLRAENKLLWELANAFRKAMVDCKFHRAKATLDATLAKIAALGAEHE